MVAGASAISGAIATRSGMPGRDNLRDETALNRRAAIRQAGQHERLLMS